MSTHYKTSSKLVGMFTHLLNTSVDSHKASATMLKVEIEAYLSLVSSTLDTAILRDTHTGLVWFCVTGSD